MNALDNIYKIGVDVGSTTLKLVILNESNEILYKTYRRHRAEISTVFKEELNKIINQYPKDKFSIRMTGSAGMGIAERMDIPFIQEVVASVETVKVLYPKTKILIDLGGEDAKIVFFEKGKNPDIRMNGSCAGGTGAFIDQMAYLMNISIDELATQALRFEKIYPIASRCGVFAKTDVQNLISRNISIPDIAASILHAVALQSITSLARGYDLTSQILCIGGPLTFIPALRRAFSKVLEIELKELMLPENSEYFPALGSALYGDENQIEIDLQLLVNKSQSSDKIQSESLDCLFNNIEEYEAWKKTRKIKKLRFQSLG